MRGKFGVSERRACRVLDQHCSTQRHVPRNRNDEGLLVKDMIELPDSMVDMDIAVLLLYFVRLVGR